MSDAARFAQYVSAPNERGCTLWTGYAVQTDIGPRGRFGFKGRNAWASRVAYELAHGAIPNGMFVCHTCDNGLCVNVAHLFLGDAAANNRDKASKGRASRFFLTRTHCKLGHPYDAENTKHYINPNTGKSCRQCRICLKITSDKHNRAKARRVTLLREKTTY